MDSRRGWEWTETKKEGKKDHAKLVPRQGNSQALDLSPRFLSPPPPTTTGNGWGGGGTTKSMIANTRFVLKQYEMAYIVPTIDTNTFVGLIYSIC